MDAFSLILMLVVLLVLTVLGMSFCIWMMKKAGIPMNGLGYSKKLFYDNSTMGFDSGRGHRSGHLSKKGGKLSVEITQTRGVMTLEFYTKDGRVLQRWRTGDPLSFTVELPPGAVVYRRGKMEHFSGTITFR